MKNIYQIFEAKQHDGSWFRKYEVPADLDLPPGYVDYDPPENLGHPRFVFGTGWVEDDEAALDSLKKENAALKAKTDSMAQLNAKLMMNDLTMTKDIEALKAQLNPVENVETETEAE